MADTTPVNRKVLVVENDPQVARLERMILALAGFTVMLAETGLEGLRLARAELPAAVVLEVDVPGLSGLEVCRQLKTDPKTRHIPVLFCSRIPDARDSTRHVGADGFLDKPGEVMQLAERLKRLLET